MKSLLFVVRQDGVCELTKSWVGASSGTDTVTAYLTPEPLGFCQELVVTAPSRAGLYQYEAQYEGAPLYRARLPTGDFCLFRQNATDSVGKRWRIDLCGDVKNGLGGIADPAINAQNAAELPQLVASCSDCPSSDPERGWTTGSPWNVPDPDVSVRDHTTTFRASATTNVTIP